MSKQDRQPARTVSELMQRMGLGKAFAEIMGVATDARDAANEARDAAAEAKQAADNANDKLTPDEVFNILTDNGKKPGIFKDEDGQIYINASYLKSGMISADMIDGSALRIENGATIGKWRVDGDCLRADFEVEDGVVNTIWIEPTRVVYIYSQEAGYGVISSWDNIIKAANSYADLEARVAALEGR